MSENSQEPGAPARMSREKAKPVVAKVSIIPLIKKYFKTVGLLVGIWTVGYFRFSATWLLIPPFFYILNEEYRKKKDNQKKFAKEAAVDEKSAVLSRIQELPSWVFFPDVERAEWLNKNVMAEIGMGSSSMDCILPVGRRNEHDKVYFYPKTVRKDGRHRIWMVKQMWPYIGEYVKGILKTSVEGQISNSLPSSLQPFRFEKIDLGDAPPRIGGVKVYIDNIKRDEIIMDLEIFLASDTNIKVCLKGMNAGIKDLMIHGHLRCVMQLCNKMPIIGGLNVFFLNPPTVDFDLTNAANFLDLPMLSNSLRSVIQDQLNYYLVLPNKIPIKLVDAIDLQRLHHPMPQGVLRLHMVAGRELKKADFKLMGKGKSDPYCKIFIGAQTFKTKVIENTVSPVWNSYFEAVVDQKHGQFAEVEVLDQDPGDDDELGTASVDIQNVAEKSSVDTWLPLENVETGMVHIRALWLHLSKNPEDLEKAVKSNQEQEISSITEDHLSSALLMVHLDSAKALPRSKKSMSEPSPYVKLTLGNLVEKSIPKPKTSDPKWEENFQFLVHDPRNQDMLVEVYDSNAKKKVLDASNKEKKLGVLTVSLKSLLSMPDMTVNQPYQLRNSGPQSKISMRIVLRILSKDKPPNYTVEEEEIAPEKEQVDKKSEKAHATEKQGVPERTMAPKAKEKEPENLTLREKRFGSEKSAQKPIPEASAKIAQKEKSLVSGLKEKPDVLTSELPEDWARDDPPVPIEEPEATPAEAAPAASKSEEEPAKPAEAAPAKPAPSTAPTKPLEPIGVEDIIPQAAQETSAPAEFSLGDGDTISNASSTLERTGSELRQRNVGSSSDMGLGKIQLTLRYSSNRSRLIIVVHKCLNLIPCDDDNLADPYVRLYLLPDKSSASKRKTQTVKNNLMPIFDETFEWQLPLNQVTQRTLDIQVKNKNSMFSKARVHMGQVVINLAEVDLSKATTEWYDLDDPIEDSFKDD